MIPCRPCNPNAYGDNPENGREFKPKNISRPWEWVKGNHQVVREKTIRSKKTREDYN